MTNAPVTTVSVRQAIALAKQHQVTGKLAQSEALYRAVLEREPQCAEVMNLLGVLCCQKGEPESGVQWIGQAIAIDADVADYHNNLGCAYRDTGKLHEAVASFVNAIQLNAYIPAVYKNLCTALEALNEIDAAAFALRLARWITRRLKSSGWSKSLLDIATTQELALFYKKLGFLLFYERQFYGATRCFRQVVNWLPQSLADLTNLALCMNRTGHYEQAISAASIALELAPKHINAHLSLALAYGETGRYDMAITHCREIIDNNELEIHTRVTLATYLYHASDLVSAESIFRLAIASAPDDAHLHDMLAVTLLKQGKYGEGWQEHEWRIKNTPCGYNTSENSAPTQHSSPWPLWQGQDICGKRLLIYCEQGLGDAIQFIRFVPRLAAMGGEVHILCHWELCSLFSGLNGIESVAYEIGINNHYDYQCRLMSLPALLKIDSKSGFYHKPYLQAEPTKVDYFSKKITKESGFRVALVWGGAPRSKAIEKEVDGRRSIPLSTFAPLSDLPITLYNAQKGHAANQLAEVSLGFSLIDYTKEFQDFTDTAAFLENIDLLISVDTSVAHLAGALGKPVWLLSRFDGCWRWLTGIDHSPWYPSMRIFRQKTPGDWGTVMLEVTRALEQRLMDKTKEGIAEPESKSSGSGC